MDHKHIDRRQMLGQGLAAVAAGGYLASLAQAEPAGDDLRARMEKRTYRDEAGHELLYRIFVPKVASTGRQCALLVFLHGAGERGGDNEAQLKHAQVLRFIGDDAQAKQPTVLVAPQCPTGRWWQEPPLWRKDMPASPDAGLPGRLVWALLDSLSKQYPIDPARRYVTGLSMGGFGSLGMVLERPDYWAAAMPICGGTDNSRAADLAKTPMWIFHGADDPVVKPEFSRSLVKALKEAGASPRYTEYPGVKHDSWVKAYQEPEMVDWLFAQKRAAK